LYFQSNEFSSSFSLLFILLLSSQQVDSITPLIPEESVPFVGEALRRLRAEVGNQSTVLGFVGAPFTLATYIVEGNEFK
jgi:uroporphyrinogen decarboxylase